MKKLLTWLLFAALIISLFGCTHETPPPEPTNHTEPTEPTNTQEPTTTESSSDETTSNPEPPEDNGYTALECIKISKFRTVNLGYTEDATALSVSIPSNWTLRKITNSEYEISRGGAIIGKVYVGTEQISDGEKTLVFEETTKKAITITSAIYSHPLDNESSYGRKITYSYTNSGEEKSFIFDFDYTETDDSSLEKMINRAQITETKILPEMGHIPFSEGNGKKSILILGNSFVNYSKIGDTLNDLCGNQCRIEAISRGYASIDEYSTDNIMLSRIKRGEFGILFLCGLYSYSDIESLPAFIDACEASNTILVLFPAHNESAEKINAFHNKYPDIHLLNWREELETLALWKVNYEDLCYLDEHKHSTPLAGYIGAQMIYRAIFGEIPTKSVSTAISQAYVKNMLGDYVKTGIIETVIADSMYYFG